MKPLFCLWQKRGFCVIYASYINTTLNYEKKITYPFAALLLTQFAQAQFGDVLKKAKQVVSGGDVLSQEDAGNGLKEALNAGIGEAVDFLSAKDGYFASPYKSWFLTKPKKW